MGRGRPAGHRRPGPSARRGAVRGPRHRRRRRRHGTLHHRRGSTARPGRGSGTCPGATGSSASSSGRTARSGSRTSPSIRGATGSRRITRRCTASSACPITVKGRSVGNLYLTDKAGADEFSEDDQALVEIVRGPRRDRDRERAAPRAGPAARHRRRAGAHQPGPARRDHPEHLRRRACRSRTCPELIRDDPEEVERRVERAIDSLHLTIRDIRNFIFGLRPELLSGTTLINGLVAVVEEFRHNSMIDVELHVGDVDEEPDPDGDRRTSWAWSTRP